MGTKKSDCVAMFPESIEKGTEEYAERLRD